MNTPRIKLYYYLAKPGIVYANAMTAGAAFLFGSKGDIDFITGLVMLAGIGLIIASGCVFNNYFDRGIDSHMSRTKKRALVSGSLSVAASLRYGFTLGVLGTLLLAFGTNVIALIAGLVGWVVYVAVYTPLKKRSVYGTLVGSIAGAVPPVVGYAAATGQFNAVAALLFFILVCWQMPHFYAIAIYRLKDYKAAKVPVLPLKRGILATKIQMALYIVAFMVTSSLLAVFDYAGTIYLIVVALLGATWLWFGLQGFVTKHDDKWAKSLFGVSLLVLLGFSFIISVDAWLV